MADPRTSIAGLIEHLRRLSDDELTHSLKSYLREGVFGDVQVYTSLERHRFVEELFNSCDSALQEKLRTTFAGLLETFEAKNPKDTREYLFYLIPLAAAIRSNQAKERLRRWLRNGTFDRWKYDTFDLTTELLVTTSAYDSDDEWVDFILRILPRKPIFRDCALAAYRALWQTRGLACLSLLPDVLVVADLEDEGFSKNLGYLLRLAITKAGAERVGRMEIEVLNEMKKPVHEVWTVVLRLDEVIGRELSKYRKDLTPLSDYLQEVWDKAVDRWNDELDPEEAYEAFDKLLEVPEKDWDSINVASARVRAAFKFRGKFMLEISDEHTYILERCEEFFTELDYERVEEAAYVAGVGSPYN